MSIESIAKQILAASPKSAFWARMAFNPIGTILNQDGMIAANIVGLQDSES
jgi:hypothetical protein